MQSTPQDPDREQPAGAEATPAHLNAPAGVVRVGDFVDECFRCRYDLSEMPVIGRCSECGQHYDKRMTLTLRQRLWQWPGNLRYAAWVVLMLICDIPRATVQEWDWWSQILPSGRTVAIFLVVFGNAVIVITMAWAALWALGGGML